MPLRPKRCPARFAFLLEHPLRRYLLGLPRLLDCLPLRSGMRILDLGAGSGVVAEAVGERAGTAELVLVDAQVNMLRRARRRLRRAGLSLGDYAVALGEALPFAADVFDLVLMVTVLGEVDDVKTVLGEAHRVLRPGGVLSVSEHLPDPDFRSLPVVRDLVRPLGFVERERRGGRWSFTVNFEKGAVAA